MKTLTGLIVIAVLLFPTSALGALALAALGGWGGAVVAGLAWSAGAAMVGAFIASSYAEQSQRSHDVLEELLKAKEAKR